MEEGAFLIKEMRPIVEDPYPTKAPR